VWKIHKRLPVRTSKRARSFLVAAAFRIAAGLVRAPTMTTFFATVVSNASPISPVMRSID